MTTEERYEYLTAKDRERRRESLDVAIQMIKEKFDAGKKVEIIGPIRSRALFSSEDIKAMTMGEYTKLRGILNARYKLQGEEE